MRPETIVHDRANTFDDRVRELVAAVAGELERFCAEHGRNWANERDHLTPCTKCVIEGLLPTWTPTLTHGPFGFGERHGWTKLGRVDVVLHEAERLPIFVEVKCGAENTSLAPCSWDAVKLGTAIAGGNARAAYLLAGAPTAVWQTAARVGAEFFTDAVHETVEIRDRYRAYFAQWEKEPHIPGRVPAALMTTAVASVGLAIAGTAWEIRASRVEGTGGWWDWPLLDQANRKSRDPNA